MKKRIALIGFGALSHIFLSIYQKQLTDSYELCGVLTRPIPEKAEAFPFFADSEELLSARPDYVLEFAGGGAVREYGETILQNGANLIIVSIGALADDALYARLRTAACRGGSRLYLPNGALGGFDVLRTMALAGVDEISIENRKPPAGLNGAPYLNGRQLPEDCETQVFSGTAREAIAAFPHNVNVAVAASLAAADPDKAQVQITSVPGLKQNTHIVRARNALAQIELNIASLPDPANPRSSTVTAWSVAALLSDLASPVSFF